MRAIALIPLLIAPVTAHAACQGETALSCDIGAKHLELCVEGGNLRYAFGPKARPEIVLNTTIPSVDYTPWNGIGRSVWEAVRIHNDDVVYEVWSALDRLDEAGEWQAGVNVLQGETVLAELACAPGFIAPDFYTIYTAKEAQGLCWNFDSESWTRSCE